MRRRTVLIGLGIAAAAVAATRQWPSRPLAASDFVPLSWPEGFRSYASGSQTQLIDPFAGIGTRRTAEDARRTAELREQVAAAPCAALYPTHVRQSPNIPIAAFSDYYCPFCRIQTEILADLESDRSSGVSVSWHELPIFGESSERAARAALAAARQDAYAAFQARLARTQFQATPEYLNALAEGIGLDPVQFATDMNSEAVAEQLDVSAALASLFGFVGTPCLVIGRTVVQGQVPKDLILQIVAMERADPWEDHCTFT